MALTLEAFNAMPPAEAEALMLDVCHSHRFAAAVAARRPYASLQALEDAAAAVWAEAGEADILEAFAGHARIGDLDALRDRFGAAAREQGQVAAAGEDVLQDLLAMNRAYEEKHGFIFIVCASGRSAEEMRDILAARLPNSRAQELANGAAEQAKITRLRLRQRFQPSATIPSGDNA